MNKKIYKFKLGLDGRVEMPKGTIVIKVGTQNSQFMLWGSFLVMNEKKIEVRKFSVMPTGAEINCDLKYIDTFFDEPFVWHLHEDVARGKIVHGNSVSDNTPINEESISLGFNFGK